MADVAAPAVTLLVRSGCQACADAEVAAQAVCGPLGIRWRRVDVFSDTSLLVTFLPLVPVTFVNGKQISEFGLTESILRRALGRASRG